MVITSREWVAVGILWAKPGMLLNILQGADQPLYSFSRATVTKDHKTGGWKQQRCVITQFWTLEVRDQGVGRAVGAV